MHALQDVVRQKLSFKVSSSCRR